MAENFKDGVSRVLEIANRNFSNLIWQEGKPPLDSELNFMGQISWEALSEMIRSQTHSGFLLDPTRAEEDFVFYDQSTNYFEINRNADNPLIALVNGWVIPVLGTKTDDGVSNAINLPEPPTSDSQTNIIFLEVWRAVIDADDSTNKPSANKIFPYGNVDFTATTLDLDDELKDPTLGFETTKRVQVQYRLRVQNAGVDLIHEIEALSDGDIVAQGAQNSPVLGYPFMNQSDNGDVGLWRAGNGDTNSQTDLGTVDGYVYAVPLCAVFRRNSSRYQAVSTGAPNHHGSISRRPTASSGRLQQAILAEEFAYNTATPQTLTFNPLDSSLSFSTPLEDTGFVSGANRFLVLGEGLNREVISISSIDVTTNPKEIVVASRARAGTTAKTHAVGTKIEVYISRPDGKYADQITKDDVLDMRHAVTLGDWDYNRLLDNAVRDLITNNLKTAHKQAGTGSNSVGLKVEEVSIMTGGIGEANNYVNIVDAPNGIRTTWSDSATMQTDVSFLIDPSVSIDSNGLSSTSIDAGTTDSWTIGAKFNPTGFFFQNNGSTTFSIRNGSWIKFSIGGADGVSGARAGLKEDLSRNVVRFVAPREMNGRATNPIRLNFLSHNRPNAVGETGTQGLYASPTEISNFEKPFIVLGQSVMTSLSNVVPDITANGVGHLRNLSYFTGYTDSSSALLYKRVWAIKTTTDMTVSLSQSVVHGTTTLSDLITDNQTDFSGYSSKAYLVLYGNPTEEMRTNNGVFRVIGAGANAPFLDTLKYGFGDGGNDWFDGTASSNDELVLDNWIYLVRVDSNETTNFLTDPNNTNLSFEIRTQYLDSRDTDTMIAFTAVEAGDVSGDYSYIPPLDATRQGNISISTTVLYPPAHGAMARVLDNVHTIGIRSYTSPYLRNDNSQLDTAGVSEIPLANGEVYLPTGNHTSQYSKALNGNRISGEGTWVGESITNGLLTKESESFIDVGSKTVILRPFRDQAMKAIKHTGIAGSGVFGNVNYDDGTPKFGGQTLFGNGSEAYLIPTQAMPQFGRQDIPHHRKTSDTDPYMKGINHLILDQRDNTNGAFNIIGGDSNGTGVYPLVFATGGNYGHYVTDDANLKNQSYFSAKKVTITGKPSEFGDTIKGIKLPPFFGVARLFGIYIKSGSATIDFATNAPDNGIGSHESDRETNLPNGALNLLREDSDTFPLYILQGGGTEITRSEETEAHTYVITEHAIDTSKIPNFTSFDDYDYVVECTVFGFGLGFINQNNFVLPRASKPNGSATDSEIINLRMCLPSAIPETDEVYIAGSRTVYQGDPFYTIGGSSPSYTDYPYRYGNVTWQNSYLLRNERGQFETDGSSAIEIPNRRSLQVLASTDFYTTMGTGAVGGFVSHSNFSDVGYINYYRESSTDAQNDRISLTSSEALPQTKVGLFTERLNEKSEFASATIGLNGTRFAYYTGNVGEHRLKIDYILASGTVLSYLLDNTSAPSDMEALVLEIEAFCNTNGIPFRSSNLTGNNDYGITFYARERGSAGNQIQLEVSLVPKSNSLFTNNSPNTGHFIGLVGGETPILPKYLSYSKTKVYLKGGTTVPVNAYSGKDSQIDVSLVGLTSRLPLGILVNDHDFLCEDILRDESTRLQTLGSKLTSTPTTAGVDENGNSYTKIVGGAGEVLQMGDGAPLVYGAFPLNGGTKTYRVYRGGGSVFGASGDVKGGPLTFLNDSISSELQPVLKGSVLACRAMLVRNFKESAFDTQNLSVRSFGDEIQLLVVTNAVFRGSNVNTENLPLSLGGSISPSGFGEGFASADRFRIKGLPLVRGNSPDVEDVNPATYNKNQ